MQRKHRDNFTFLTQAPVPRVVMTMSVSTIISMLVTSLYNLADTFFVGQINTQATAAVGIVFSVMFVMQAFGFFFGHGSGNYISRELGAQRHHNAEAMAATGFLLSLGFGLVAMVVCLLFLRPLSVALGSTPTILPYTERYLGIVLLGAPLFTSSLTLNNQLRFQGNAAYAMIGIVTGAVLNVALDALFIMVLGWGIAGAAWATVAGQAVSFSILLAMTRRGGNLRIKPSRFRLSREFIKEILGGGTPSLMRQGLGSISSIMLNVAAAAFGDAAVAAMAIVNRVVMMVMSVIIGIGQGYQPLCGFSYGAKLYDRVKQGFWFCVRIGTAFLTVCAVLGWVWAGPVVGVFRDDPEVIAIGTRALRWQVISLPLMATYMYANMMLQTIGMSLRANVLAASRRGIFFIPAILILPHFFGLTGVIATQMVADLCSVALCMPILLGSQRQMR